MATKTRQTINGVHENRTNHFLGTVKLGRKLPLRNHTPIRFIVELPGTRSVAMQTFGILRVPKRLARLVAESDEFSILNTHGILKVPRRFAREITTPHKYSILDR